MGNTSFTATFSANNNEEKEEERSPFDKDKHLVNMIEEFKHMKKDLEYLEARIIRRVGDFFPKDETIYVEAQIKDVDLYDKDQPIQVETKNGTRIYLKPEDIINKEVFTSPLGELMYGKVSKGQDTESN